MSACRAARPRPLRSIGLRTALLLICVGSAAIARAQITSGSYVGDGAASHSIAGLGFQPDIVIVKVDFDGQTDPNPPCSGGDDCSSAVIRTSTMSAANSKPVKGNQAYAGNMITALGPDGFTVGNDLKVNALNSCPASTATPCTYYWVAIKADASIKVGSYTGNGGTLPITGLGFAPEWVATIPTDTASPMMRFSVDANTYHWWSGSPFNPPLSPTITSLDATGFTVQNGCGAPCNQNVNLATYHYIAMDETPGHVKVGLYAGDASTPRTISGVGFQPAYVMTKGLDPATFEQVHRTAAMPLLESVTFRGPLTSVALGNSGKHIRALQPDGFVIGGGGGAGNLVNAAGSDYAYLALGSPSCSALTTTVDATYAGYRVTAPASCELGFGRPGGGGVHLLFDLELDPGRAWDLAGGDVAGREPGLWSDELAGVAGTNYQSGRNITGFRISPLEVTGARVKMRQEAFFQGPSTGPVLGGVKGTGDYTIHPTGRMALHWVRRYTNPAPINYGFQQLQTVVNYHAAGDPLNTWLTYTDTGAIPPARTTPPDPRHAFLLDQIEQNEARTDILTILSKDWAVEASADATADLPNLFLEAAWNSGAGSIAPGSPPEGWDFLFYFKPTNLVNHTDPAVTSRSADYRTPAVLTINGGKGSRWSSASESTSAAGDWFNEGEAAYPLDLDPTLGLDLDIDGSGTTRYKPFFKIRQWRSLVDAPVVTLEGAPLAKNVDYKADVKPVSRSHWASTLNWHCTMESTTACNSSNLDVGVGVAGSTTGTTATSGRYGNGLLFTANTDKVVASSSDFSPSIGAIDFWYQPGYPSNDSARYLLWYWQAGSGSDFHCFSFEKTAGNNLVLSMLVNYSNNVCTITDANSASYSASVSVASGAFAWRAYDWVHLKASWNVSGLAGSRKLRIVVNGTEAATSNSFAPPGGSSTLTLGGCSLNCPGNAGANPNGVLDEVHIYGGLEYNSYDTNSPLAFGGMTSDAGEFLADTGKNATLALTPLGPGSQGSYLYFGADAQFRGLNVALQTPGAWSVAGTLAWEYWDGTQWSSLSGFGLTDTTNAFTRNGTVYWTSDPTGWAPYSVNGGPELYYLRLHLASGSYATQPVERIVKTDILLFQYCSDITTAAQTFAFAVPPPTAVKLESFEATAGDSSVLVSWRTGSELDNLGFYLYRALSDSGPWTRLNASLIPGLGSSALGQAYSYRDTGLQNGTRYYYRLEDVDTKSKVTSHGPVSAVPVAGGTGAGAGAPPSNQGAAKRRSSSCPDWVVSAYGSLIGSSTSAAALVCTRHGDPESVALQVLSHDSRQATLELRTGGFYALHSLSGAGEASGKVRVFVPGFDLSDDAQAIALPFRRALVEGVVGRRAQLGGVRALEQVSFAGLVPSALGKAEMQVSLDGTVRAVRRGSRGTNAARASVDLAWLLPSVFQGEVKSAVVAMSPLRYDARRKQLVLAKRLLVKLMFTGRELGESGRGSVGRRQIKPPKPVATGEVVARLYTTERGLYAASFEELFPGRSGGFVPSQLRLERQGEAVALHVEPAGAVFGPGSRLFFYADVASDSSSYSSETAWELVHASGGLAMPLGTAAPTGGAVRTPAVGQATFEVNRYYQPGLLDAPDLWLWDAAVTGATRALPFTLAGVDASAATGSTLDVYLQGGSESGQAVDHHVSVSVNGVLVGEVRFAGKTPYRMSLSVPVGALHEGANDLELSNVGDTGVQSVVFLDRFTLSYPRLSSLGSGSLAGSWGETGVATLAGAANGSILLDVTAADGAGGAPSWLSRFDVTGSSLRFRAEAGHRYLAVSQQGLMAPRVATVTASSLRSTTNQADYLLIAPRAFLSAAEPLLARREDQGLQVRAVAFEEIADEFGHGQASAEAIKGFLAYAYQSWARPSPRYVVLLGDASYDPRHFIASSVGSPLPALWTKTSYLWTASDPLLAAVNGEDALPDLAIGRLPATTVEEAQALVDKLLAWEDSGQGLNGQAALVADNPDLAGDFEANARDIAGSFLGGRSQLLLLSELGGGTRGAIQAALDGGLSYLDYVGHGGAAVWASENVWNSWDVASLQAQSRQPLLLTMDCLNGYFVAPTFDSLSESLVKAQGRGAIAAFSPSGLSEDTPAHQYHRALMAELVSGRHARLGDAVLAAQQAYAQSGLMPELLTIYHLLGDPATPLR